MKRVKQAHVRVPRSSTATLSFAWNISKPAPEWKKVRKRVASPKVFRRLYTEIIGGLKFIVK